MSSDQSTKKVCKKKKAQQKSQQPQKISPEIFSIAEDVGEDQPSEMKNSISNSQLVDEDAVPIKFKLNTDDYDDDSPIRQIQNEPAVVPKEGIKVKSSNEPIQEQKQQLVKNIKSSLKQNSQFTEQKQQSSNNQKENQPKQEKVAKFDEGITQQKKGEPIPQSQGENRNSKRVTTNEKNDENYERSPSSKFKQADGNGHTKQIEKELKLAKEQIFSLEKQIETLSDENPKGGQSSASYEKQLKILKDQDVKIKKELNDHKKKLTQTTQELNEATSEAQKFEKQYLGTVDQLKSLQSNVAMKEGQVKSLNEKVNQMKERNKELEMQNIDINKRSDKMYKEKMEIESIRDQMHIQIMDLSSNCEVVKRENKTLSDTLIDRTKQANDRIQDYIKRIEEYNRDNVKLKQEKLEYEQKASAERNAKEDIKIQLKVVSSQISQINTMFTIEQCSFDRENEELRKKLEKKEEKLEELEDYIEKLKSKLRKFDTNLTIKDEFGQIKEFRSEKYSDLLNKKHQDEMNRMGNDLQNLTESMDAFRANSFKIESEKENLRVENITLKEELKRQERLLQKDHSNHESEVLDLHRSIEQTRLKMQSLQLQNEELEKNRVSKLEVLRDSEFNRIEQLYQAAKNRIEELQQELKTANVKIDNLTQTITKKQMILGDMYFQNENLKEEVEYLSQIKKTSLVAQSAQSIPLKNKQNEKYFQIERGSTVPAQNYQPSQQNYQQSKTDYHPLYAIEQIFPGQQQPPPFSATLSPDSYFTSRQGESNAKYELPITTQGQQSTLPSYNII